MNDVPTVSCHRATLTAISASGTEPYWARSEPLSLVENVGGGAPSQGTVVRTAWDDRELRVLFDSVDSEPWATLTARDAALYTEEVVEVFLDPVGDLESYFEIEVNPLNAVLDLVLRRSRSGYLKNFAWQCDGLQTAVTRTVSGWIAELGIPFASMSPEPVRPGAQWRVNFLRIDRPRGRDRELSAWSSTRIGNFHVPQRFGRLQFAE